MKSRMHLNASPRLFGYAKSLRRNETKAEKILWEYLRDRKMEGEKFRRQHPGKKFVLDFYCYRIRLGIELDGRQHEEQVNQFYDNDRSEILAEYNIYILRFSNNDVENNIDFVLNCIQEAVLYLQGKRN